MREICTSGSTRGRWAAIYLLPSVLLYRPQRFIHSFSPLQTATAQICTAMPTPFLSASLGVHRWPNDSLPTHPAAPSPNGFDSPKRSHRAKKPKKSPDLSPLQTATAQLHSHAHTFSYRRPSAFICRRMTHSLLTPRHPAQMASILQSDLTKQKNQKILGSVTAAPRFFFSAFIGVHRVRQDKPG